MGDTMKFLYLFLCLLLGTLFFSCKKDKGEEAESFSISFKENGVSSKLYENIDSSYIVLDNEGSNTHQCIPEKSLTEGKEKLYQQVKIHDYGSGYIKLFYSLYKSLSCDKGEGYISYEYSLKLS